MNSFEWRGLNSQQVGKYGEHFVKMEFTRYSLDVYTSEIDDKGIDLVVCTRKPRKHYDVQVKSVRESTTAGSFNYVFFRHKHFNPRENLYAAIALFIEDQLPELYLIPSIVWLESKPPFVNRNYGSPLNSAPEWGLNLSRKNLPLLEEFTFDKGVKLLQG